MSQAGLDPITFIFRAVAIRFKNHTVFSIPNNQSVSRVPFVLTRCTGVLNRARHGTSSVIFVPGRSLHRGAGHLQRRRVMPAAAASLGPGNRAATLRRPDPTRPDPIAVRPATWPIVQHFITVDGVRDAASA